VLIQDYHFALLPRMLKERLPNARVAIFWHIPWPNPESFSICPWQRGGCWMACWVQTWSAFIRRLTATTSCIPLIMYLRPRLTGSTSPLSATSTGRLYFRSRSALTLSKIVLILRRE